MSTPLGEQVLGRDSGRLFCGGRCGGRLARLGGRRELHKLRSVELGLLQDFALADQRIFRRVDALRLFLNLLQTTYFPSLPLGES